MSAGSVQTIVVCMPAETGTTGPCPDGQVMQTQTAYVIDSTYWATAESALTPFDAATAGEFWTMAFVTVIGLWLIAKCASAVVDMFRK